MLNTYCLFICLMLSLLRQDTAHASKSCFYCRGIKCLRSNYQETEQCVDELDACISIFQDGIIQAQGCLEKLDDHYKKQCEDRNKSNLQCEVCLTEKCNKVGTSKLSCLQCLDSMDEPCGTAPEQLAPQICEIARSGRSFCFVSLQDKRVERGCALTLEEQRSCLADENCQLCDPLEIPHCNSQLLDPLQGTTEPPISSSTSSSSSTTSTRPTSPSTTDPSTTQSTKPPTTQSSKPPTTQSTNPPPTTPKPSTAQRSYNKNLIISLVILNLAMLFLCTQ